MCLKFEGEILLLFMFRVYTWCLYGGLFHLTIITIIDKRLVYIYTILIKPTRFTSESLVINLYERLF